MQQFMAMVLSIQIFVISVSAAFYFFGTELGISALTDRSLDLTHLQTTLNSTAQSYQTNPFNAALIFGDFGRGITNFMNIISGGYLFTLMAKFGMAQSFIYGVQIIFGIGVVMTLIYLVSGRG